MTKTEIVATIVTGQGQKRVFGLPTGESEPVELCFKANGDDFDVHRVLSDGRTSRRITTVTKSGAETMIEASAD